VRQHQFVFRKTLSVVLSALPARTFFNQCANTYAVASGGISEFAITESTGTSKETGRREEA
jgi:hypothetical protein